MSDIAHTKRLAAFASELAFDALPDQVVRRTKVLMLDTLGVALGARRFLPSNTILMEGLAVLAQSGGNATIIGDARSWQASAAALVNGALAHGMDFDDTHLVGLHPSAVLLPAALAAGELSEVDGETLLAGLVAGYEVMCRVGAVLIRGNHYGRGFHPTATAGVFGAAAVAGRMLHLDREEMESAFGLCGSQVAGSSQFLLGGGWNKHFHVGAAAANGLLSAVVAGKGYRGAEAALEGARGVLAGYTEDADPSGLSADLGARWETLRIGVKPYPCCRHAHAALDGLIELRRAHHISEQNVRSVRIGLCAEGVRVMGVPADAKRRSRSATDAQFSMHFVAAAALKTGYLVWEDYDLARTGELDTLCDRIDVALSDAVEASYPDRLGAEIEIATSHGIFSAFVETPVGEPETFPDREACERKFRRLAEPLLQSAAVSELIERVFSIERERRVADFAKLLQLR